MEFEKSMFKKKKNKIFNLMRKKMDLKGVHSVKSKDCLCRVKVDC